MAIDSLAIYNNLVEMNQSNPEAYFYRANYCINTGNLVQAQSDLESALDLDSTVAKVRIKYADLRVAQLDLEGGKYHYEYVLSKDSTSVGALMGLGRIYAILKNNAAAIHYLSLLLEKDPHYAEAYFLKGMIYRADFYETGRQESWDRAMSSYQTAVEQNSDYYSAYVEMGVMHDQVGSDLAMDYYNSALAIYPESIEAWYNIGMFFQERGEIDTALATYRTLNLIDSTYADAYYNQGYIHLIFTKHIDSAAFYFSRATNFDPEYFQAYNNLGLCYEELGDKNAARNNYQKAVDINPDFQLAKDNLNRLK